ncbi:MAG: type II secretion system F family protein [Coxiellaceae bacterium]|nr:type II secretion system F family protein [Coxiellaceae bacterium]
MKSKLNSQLLIRLIDQWHYGLQSGLALNQTFTLLLSQSKNKKLYKVNQHCLTCINQGHPLSYALQQIKNLKPSWMPSYIAAGESQGDLGKVLQQISQQLTQQQTIKKNIKKALFYPCMVLSIALLITIALLIFVIPQFKNIYQQLNAPLPYITQLALNTSYQVQHHGLRILLCITLPIIMLFIGIQKSKRFAILIHTALIKLPFVSDLILMVNLSRWYSLISLLSNAGISIDQTLFTANNSLSNLYLKQSLSQLITGIQQGQSIASQLQTIAVLSPFDSQMIQLGESTGQLSQICQQLAKHYQQQVQQFSTIVSQWLEPMIMLLLAVIVGGLVMAMYMPIFNLGNIM